MIIYDLNVYDLDYAGRLNVRMIVKFNYMIFCDIALARATLGY